MMHSSVSATAPKRAVSGAVAGMVSAAIPPFLVGALSLQMGREIDLTAGDVGIAVAAYYLVSGVLSPVAGRVVATLGVAPALHAACALSTAGLASIALAGSPGQIVITLGLLGVPNSVVQPASNEVLSQVENTRLRGLSFGLVQSAIPAATLLAGVLLAVASHGSSWRYAVGTVAVLTLAAQFLVTGTHGTGSRRVRRAEGSSGHRARATDPGQTIGGAPLMAAMMLAAFLASAASTSLPSFLAARGAQAGLAPVAIAGSQVAGSVSCIAARILAAWRGSHLEAHRMLAVLAALFGLGFCGFLLLAWGTPWSFAIGAVLAYACGWGWNGLFNLGVARARPGRVAASTGLTQGGVFLGGMAGPLLFALLIRVGGYGDAWVAMALTGVGAAAAILYAASRWRRDCSLRRDQDPADAAVVGAR